MTAPLLRLRRAPRPRPVIVSVSNYWRLAEGRQVLVRQPSGELVTAYVPDAHPALVRFLERAA